LFRQLPEGIEGVEVEWRLFEAAVASSTARVCGQKRLGVAKDGKKVTRWWN